MNFPLGFGTLVAGLAIAAEICLPPKGVEETASLGGLFCDFSFISCYNIWDMAEGLFRVYMTVSIGQRTPTIPSFNFPSFKDTLIFLIRS